MRVVLRVKAKWLNKMRAADRCPEKAGVGGSIPSLATMFSIMYTASRIQFHSVSFQKLWPVETRLSGETGFWGYTSAVLHSAFSKSLSESGTPGFPGN
jgi:hypothetical protein